MTASANVKARLSRNDLIRELVRCYRAIRCSIHRDISRLKTQQIIKQYMSSLGLKKLHIGCGDAILDGWLCTDIDPHFPGVAFLDATQRFPFHDRSIDYIFCEHMIEHIGWDDGQRMLGECRRVLKLQGRIRISTPDLAVFARLHLQPDEALHDDYIRWATDHVLMWKDLGVYLPGFVVNNMFRDFGHQFIYDAASLPMTLERAGFTNIVRCCWGESMDRNLSGLESHGKTLDNEAIARFETMIFEASP